MHSYLAKNCQLVLFNSPNQCHLKTSNPAPNVVCPIGTTLTERPLLILERGLVRFFGKLKSSGSIASEADCTLQSSGLTNSLRGRDHASDHDLIQY